MRMTAESRKVLGARIKKRRKELNLSQPKLALMIGIQRSHLSRIELGQSNPGFDVIEKIAMGLEITIAELVYGIEDVDRPEHDPFGSEETSPASGKYAIYRSVSL